MRILFWPEFPTMDGYTLVAMCHELGYEGVTSPDAPFDIAVAWADVTWMQPDVVLEELAGHMPVWNIDCRDISKRTVDATMRAVFGYGVEIDPATYRGKIAVKTDENARGRGAVVTGPIADPQPQHVHQRYVECTELGRTVNYRVPVVAGTLPLCYVLGREPAVTHLKTAATDCRLVETDALFSTEEQSRILQLCERMGLDFGELDVLRDDADGRLYVIDANKTPAGMGIAYRHRWTVGQRREALQRLSAAFQAAVDAGLPRRSVSAAPPAATATAPART
jgi:hypothetical protein